MSQLTLEESVARVEAVKSERAIPTLPMFKDRFDFEYSSPSARSALESRRASDSARDQPQSGQELKTRMEKSMRDLEEQSVRVMDIEWQSMLNQKGVEILEKRSKQLLQARFSQLLSDM